LPRGASGAARHISQFYDRDLAQPALRATRFSILAMLKGYGPIAIKSIGEKAD
jgi:hypothetical protein